MDKINSLYPRVLQISVVFLGAALFWFAFVYYPKVVTDFKLGRVLPIKTVFKPVAASSYSFPIKTQAYSIEYAPKSGIYYVSVSGSTLPEYVFNRDNAKLALKTAISLTSLCNINVVYVSSSGFDVPPQYRSASDC